MSESDVITNPDAETIKALRFVRDAMRYRAIKEKIVYSDADDGMTWAMLDWCVDVASLSPVGLDEAVDQFLLSTE